MFIWVIVFHNLQCASRRTLRNRKKDGGLKPAATQGVKRKLNFTVLPMEEFGRQEGRKEEEEGVTEGLAMEEFLEQEAG